jgi:DNA-directed RNA polymerase subunit RPC12/RpoP
MLIFGLSVKQFLLATLVYLCETCGTSAPHQLVKRARRLSLFFIPVLTVGRSYLDVCTACGRTLDVPREQAEAAAQQAGTGLR